MNFIRTRIKNIQVLAKNEDGLTTVEYAILLALLAFVAFGAWQALGAAVCSNANSAANTLNNAG